MTPLDLRIRYKSETGFAPTHGYDKFKTFEFYDDEVSKCCNYKGSLAHSYIEWLEDGSDYLRILFQRETGNLAVKIKDNRYVYYSKEYADYLEQKACERYVRLEKMKTITSWDI